MSGHGSFVVLSDLDDTIKISHTLNRFRTVVRGLFSSQVYAGMPELFQEWEVLGAHFKIMSSSPIWIRERIRRFLWKHQFPEIEITLRDWIREKEIRSYKRQKLRLLCEKIESPVILVGDDSEWDPEVFHEFRSLSPEKILAIYIRRIRNRPLPDGVTGFFTAFEVAMAEYQAGRFSAPQVARIGKSILDERDPDLILPYFVASPEGLPLPLEEPFESLQAQLHDRLLRIHEEHEKSDQRP